MTVDAVAVEIADRIGTAYDYIHTRSTEGGSLVSPQVLVVTPGFDYHTTFRKFDYQLEVWLLVADQITADAVRRIRTLADPTGIKAAIEGSDPTLGGLVDDCVVASFRAIGADEMGMVGMWGGVFTLEISGATT